ncbi:cytochrome o ubiquinol oxidase subunit III [uncultured Shewanella sp.]|uniref:cytochrome o ubiquinol oxidase subunit III n=1 Tax=uncultured Shewanella sp. TaxID=173975 RepID=UPI002622FF7D|nr:cytochrome o ubiquinol oxidase subunit III [uncultured Shewanella sp.]
MSSVAVDTQQHQSDHGHDHEHDESSTTIFGFWIYIMSDCILFATLFATYAVLSSNTFGGPAGHEIFSMPFVLVETFLLLTSSFTYGLAMLAMHKDKSKQVVGWLVVTFLLGLGFICMELYEFHELITEGHGWQTSGFLSAFFGLVATHGLHVTLGLIWMIVMMYSVLRHGLTKQVKTRLTCLSLFWHFLDIIWICVFTVVYLMGAIT